MTNDPLQIHFLHLRDRQPNSGGVAPRGGCTIAFAQVDSCTLALAAAYCSEKDQYCKRVGRAIATGRLQAGKWVDTIRLDNDHDYTGKERTKLVHDFIFGAQ